jgi:hypothetical protein
LITPGSAYSIGGMWRTRTIPPIADPQAVALFSIFSDDELFGAALVRPPDADDDAMPSEAGLLIFQSESMEVTIETRMLDDIATLMEDAGAPEDQIARVAEEEVGEDEVRLVIWIGGARFWVGARLLPREGRWGVTGPCIVIHVDAWRGCPGEACIAASAAGAPKTAGMAPAPSRVLTVEGGLQPPAGR